MQFAGVQIVTLAEGEISELHVGLKVTMYAGAVEATRAAHNRLNGTHRPKSLLSGLIVCGCCGGPFSLRGQGRFACSNHVDTNSCANSRTIARDALEGRVLDGHGP